jgi:hypothetical protein
MWSVDKVFYLPNAAVQSRDLCRQIDGPPASPGLAFPAGLDRRHQPRLRRHWPFCYRIGETPRRGANRETGRACSPAAGDQENPPRRENARVPQPAGAPSRAAGMGAAYGRAPWLRSPVPASRCRQRFHRPSGGTALACSCRCPGLRWPRPCGVGWPPAWTGPADGAPSPKRRPNRPWATICRPCRARTRHRRALASTSVRAPRPEGRPAEAFGQRQRGEPRRGMASCGTIEPHHRARKPARRQVLAGSPPAGRHTGTSRSPTSASAKVELLRGLLLEALAEMQNEEDHQRD